MQDGKGDKSLHIVQQSFGPKECISIHDEELNTKKN